LTSLLLLGFLLGMRHALEADHLAAVASLATRSRGLWQTVSQGAAWGLGHTLTLVLAGGICLFASVAIPPRVAHLLEMGVGVMLLGLGLDVLLRARRRGIHFHVHRHDDGAVHLHAHGHAPDEAHPPGDPLHRLIPHLHAHAHAHEPGPAEVPLHGPAGVPLPGPSGGSLQAPSGGSLHAPPSGAAAAAHAPVRGFPRRALLVGLMHGLAGSAALLLLTLSTLSNRWLGLAYILVFGLGSILGMAILSVVIAVPMQGTARLLTGASRAVEVVTGLATMAIGAWVLAG
jgi:hypothetical protein